MKKPTKSIITSSLLALAFGAMSVGTTFALFTSKAETTINVESGVIDLKAPISVVSAWELGNVQMVGSGFSYQNSIGGSITKDENNIVHLNKLAPGDGAIFALTPDNSGTNIKTKARLVVTLEGDLADALNVEVKAGDDMVIGFNGAHTGYTPWQEVEVGNDPTAFTVKVEFPDGDNGEILFGEDNHDNQYQNKTATLVIGYEAVQGNAQTDDMLQIINNTLMTKAYQGSANKTMYDALQDLSASQVAAIQERGYVWSVEEDQFYNFTAVPTAPYKFFKMYDAMPTSQDYSIYAVGNGWTGTTINPLTVGFDAGDTSGITSITYDRHEASVGQEVTIRTNTAQTTLTINAPKDTIHHYDALGALNIIEAATASYHEFGSIAYAEIAKGRIVLEEGSDVNQIHINKKTDSSFDEVIIANNGGTEELPEKITRDAVTVAEETLVVKVVSNGESENVYVYAEGQKGTTEKTSTQNEDVESALGQLVLDNGSEPGEKAQTTEEKTTEKTEAQQDAVDKESAENDVFILANGAEESTGVYKSLAEFRDLVNSGTSYAGYTVTLARNVNLKNATWTPIGTSTYTFAGIFDGGDHVIRNLKINSNTGYAGLFGSVVGTAANAPHTSSDVWDSDQNSLISNSYSEVKYSAIIKNLAIDGFEVTNTAGNYVGTVVAYAANTNFANLTLRNGVVNGNGKTGGVVGATSDNVLLESISTESTVTVSSTGHSVGGIIGGVNRGNNSLPSHLAIFVNCINRANVSTEDTSNGIAAGILGHAGSPSYLNVVMSNCANYGEIKCQTKTAGIVAEAQKVKIIVNCVNYGKIWNDATSDNNINNILGGIAGDCSTSGLQIVTCTNYGEVIGYANNGKIAGIIGSTQSPDLIEGCVNNGTITNTKTNGASFDITSGAANVIYTNEETFVVDSALSGEMTRVTITGNATVCTNIVIDNEAIEKVFVAIDNFNGTITGLEGKTLFISGSNNTVTIPEDTVTGKVVVSGANCTLINNGTIDTIRFESASNSNVVNNGTITNTTNNLFTVSSTVNGANVTITNNGTIEASELDGAYVLYFGSGATCVVNNNGIVIGDVFGKVTVNQ